MGLLPLRSVYELKHCLEYCKGFPPHFTLTSEFKECTKSIIVYYIRQCVSGLTHNHMENQSGKERYCKKGRSNTKE